MLMNEIHRAINEFNSLYPNYYRNQSQDYMENIAKSWSRKFASVDDYDAFISALFDYEAKSDYPTPPTTRQWLDLYRQRKNIKHNRQGVRRIETPEEVMWQIYQQEMAKDPKRRNEDLARRCLPAAELFNDPDAYKRHFGKTREEMEQ